mmetsp:Transcript_17534/g.33245  ORF Transcript_17534/g.33245 Transcript_17534/m.33245 type:complete len:93 (+) Transcript_17534:1072-1350(+)
MDFALKDSFVRKAQYYLWNALITHIPSEVGRFVFLAILRLQMVKRDAKQIEHVVNIKYKYTVCIELNQIWILYCDDDFARRTVSFRLQHFTI